MNYTDQVWLNNGNIVLIRFYGDISDWILDYGSVITYDCGVCLRDKARDVNYPLGLEYVGEL
jgi:hypothetical protein